MLFGWRNQKNQKNISKTTKTNDLGEDPGQQQLRAREPQSSPRSLVFLVSLCFFCFFLVSPAEKH